MLIHKGSSSLRVTLLADRIAGDAAVQALFFECAVRIVAIAAVHEPLVHLVMKRLCKSRLHIAVAGVAKLRLRDLEETRITLEFVNAMTTRAAYSCITMRGALEVGMIPFVALQAPFICLPRADMAEPEYLRWIAASLHMLLTGSVTALAGDSLAAVQQCEASMRIVCELVAYVFMAGLASLRAQEIFRLDRCLLAGGHLLLVATGSVHTHGLPEK